MLGLKYRHTHLSWYFISRDTVKSLIHSASQGLTTGLCGKPPSVFCSVQTLACSSPWRGEDEWQLSSKEAHWWAWNEAGEVHKELAHLAPSLTSLFNRLAKLMLGNSMYSRTSKWQDFGMEVLQSDSLNRMKMPHGRTWPSTVAAFYFETDSPHTIYTWLESTRKKSGVSTWARTLLPTQLLCSV